MQNNEIVQRADNVSKQSRRVLSKLTVQCGATRKMHIRFALPRRSICLSKRAMIAALRQAELEDWQASGGDYLQSMHQPIPA